MNFKIAKLKINVSFYFAASITLMFLIDNGYNSFMSVICIIAHEGAHALVLFLCGGTIKELRLSLCEMNIVTDDKRLSKLHDFFISVSGPLANMLLFAVFFTSNSKFASVNLIIACFQLLPIHSLDGERALQAIGVSSKIRLAISVVFCFVFAVIGFFLLLQTKYNFSVLIISLFLLFNSLATKN